MDCFWWHENSQVWNGKLNISFEQVNIVLCVLWILEQFMCIERITNNIYPYLLSILYSRLIVNVSCNPINRDIITLWFCLDFSLDIVGTKHRLFKFYFFHAEERHTEWLQAVLCALTVEYHLQMIVCIMMKNFKKHSEESILKCHMGMAYKNYTSSEKESLSRHTLSIYHGNYNE